MNERLLGALIAAPFFLIGCTNTQSTKYSEPTAHRAVVSRSFASVPVPPNQVVVNGQTLQAAVPEAVSIDSLSVCDAAQAVLGAALSLSYSCTGEGDIGLEVRAGQADVLFQTFAAAVERLGGEVVINGRSVDVVGTLDGRAVGVGGPMPDGMPGGEERLTADGRTVFTIGELSEKFERRARTVTFSSRNFVVRLMPEAGEVEDVADLASALGLRVQATEYAGRIYAIGTGADIGSLEPFLSLSENTTVPVDVGYSGPSAIEAVQYSYPLVNVSYDDQLGTLWLSGPSGEVSKAFHSVRARIPSNRDIRVEAAFISSSASDARRFSVDPAISFTSGDFAISNAAAEGVAPISLVVDHLQQYQSVNVISQPSLTTSSGRPAEFISGARVPFVSSIDEEGRQSVEYQDTGIVLSVVPTLMPSGLLKLSMRLEISEVAGAGVIDNPEISTRSVQTTVEITPGDVVKLSGLLDKSNAQVNGRKLGIFPVTGSSEGSSTLSFFVTAKLE